MRNKKIPNLILNVGIIIIFFLNNLFIAYSATYLGLASLILNSPCATLLKFVLTGPGHKADTTTLLPLCLKFKNIILCCIISTKSRACHKTST